MLARSIFKLVIWKLWKCFLGKTNKLQRNRATRWKEHDSIWLSEMYQRAGKEPIQHTHLHFSQAMLQSHIFNPCISSGDAVLSRARDRQQPSKCGKHLGYYLRPNSFHDFSGITHVCQKLVMRLTALWKQGLSSQIFLPDSQRLIPGPTESMAEFPFSETEAWPTPKLGVSNSSLFILCAYTGHICSPQSLSCYAREEETPLACFI